MSDTPNNVSKPIVKKGRKISSVWLVPLVAAAVGGWLYYKSVQEAGLGITLHFENGSGIEPHKTHIMYNGVSVGTVDAISLNTTGDGVLVEAELVHSAIPLATEGTRFWLVQPRIGLRGISGLDTLISGNYIVLQAGEGAKQTSFTALPEPPAADPGTRGLKIVLLTDSHNVVTKGDPIYYRRFPVGIIQRLELTPDQDYIRVHALIYEQHREFLRKDSRFWDISGFEVTADLEGVRIRADSLTSLVAGGISFDTPLHFADSPPAPEGDEFVLYTDQEEAFRRGTFITIHMDTSEGLRTGSPVKYKGFQVGEIETLEIDDGLQGVSADIFLRESAARMAVKDSQFWVVRPKVGLAGVSGLDTIVTGNYIEVAPGPDAEEPAYDFTLLKQAPLNAGAQDTSGDPDFNLTLVAPQLGSIKPGVPIFYRDIKVGQIAGASLSNNGNSVRIDISIKNRYAPLIRERTHFFNASGFGMDLGLLGAKFKAASMSAILEGGIGFATPAGSNERPVAEHSTFILFDEPNEDWLTWAPTINLAEDQTQEALKVNQLKDQEMLRRARDLNLSTNPGN